MVNTWVYFSNGQDCIRTALLLLAYQWDMNNIWTLLGVINHPIFTKVLWCVPGALFPHQCPFSRGSHLLPQVPPSVPHCCSSTPVGFSILCRKKLIKGSNRSHKLLLSCESRIWPRILDKGNLSYNRKSGSAGRREPENVVIYPISSAVLHQGESIG